MNDREPHVSSPLGPRPLFEIPEHLAPCFPGETASSSPDPLAGQLSPQHTFSAVQAAGTRLISTTLGPKNLVKVQERCRSHRSPSNSPRGNFFICECNRKQKLSKWAWSHMHGVWVTTLPLTTSVKYQASIDWFLCSLVSWSVKWVVSCYEAQLM